MKKVLSLFLVSILLILPVFSFNINADDNVSQFESNDIKSYERFIDIKKATWYTDSVTYCFKYGYMNGVSDLRFNPLGKCTRAMFVTVLYNISLTDEQYSESSFNDVESGRWFSNPIEWAYQHGYSNGIGNGNFGPNNDVTREQLATFLYNYTKINEGAAPETGDIYSFSDGSDSSGWAINALNWALGDKLFFGTGNNMFSPKGILTRSELSKVLESYTSRHGVQWTEEEVIQKCGCDKNGISVFYNEDRSISKEVTYKSFHKYVFSRISQKYDCINGEISEYGCTECGFIYHEISRYPTGSHKWDNGVLTVKPTVYEYGEKKFTCTVCGATYTTQVPKLNKNPAGNYMSVGFIEGDYYYKYKYSADYDYLKVDNNGNLTITENEGITYLTYKFLKDSGSENYYGIYLNGSFVGNMIYDYTEQDLFINTSYEPDIFYYFYKY